MPDVAKRVAQELITNDKVDFLAGFGLTPSALAVAPLATEAKKPMIDMNAATSIITKRSPYIVRVSDTLAQVTAPLATWSLRNGITKVYTLVSDFGPGIDAETQFKKTFTAGGGRFRRSAHADAQPRVRAVPAADQRRAAAGGVRVPAGGRAGGGLYEGFRRA